ncbi:MAG TPA: hypothetical protein VIR27_04925 [Mycobacteriales bacterium]
MGGDRHGYLDASGLDGRVDGGVDLGDRDDGDPDRAVDRSDGFDRRGLLSALYHDDPDDIFACGLPGDRRRMGLDEEVADGLTARHFLERFDPRRANRPDLDPDDVTARIADQTRAQPRLAQLLGQERCVQRVYAAFNGGPFHGAERHEGSLDDTDHLLRLVERQDPAQFDEGRRARGIDAFKKGNGKHVCADSSTSIADAVAYAVALARGVDHPKVRAALEARHDPPRRPYYVHVPIVELLGENGHEFCGGYQLVGDDPREAVRHRDVWAKAGWKGGPRDGLRPPEVEPIMTFQDGVIEFRIGHNAARNGYEVISMFPRPRQNPGHRNIRPDHPHIPDRPDIPDQPDPLDRPDLLHHPDRAGDEAGHQPAPPPDQQHMGDPHRGRHTW